MELFQSKTWLRWLHSVEVFLTLSTWISGLIIREPGAPATCVACQAGRSRVAAVAARCRRRTVAACAAAPPPRPPSTLQ